MAIKKRSDPEFLWINKDEASYTNSDRRSQSKIINRWIQRRSAAKHSAEGRNDASNRRPARRDGSFAVQSVQYLAGRKLRPVLSK